MKRVSCALLVAALAGAPRAATAKKPDKQHQSELGLGMALFVNGDFRGAVGHFNDALAEAHDSAETAHIHLLRGQCFTAMSDEPDARRAFELALQQDPDAQLDPNQVPPETIELLARVRGSLHADLTLAGQGGSAFLDGKPLGPLPISQPISIGRHELEVVNADRSFDQHEAIIARPGDVLPLSFDVPHAATGSTSAAPPPNSTSPPSAATSAPPAVTTTQAHGEASTSLGLPVDLFGQLGAEIDPRGKAVAFEAGAGAGWGPVFGSVDGLVGSSGALLIRAGGRAQDLLGPLGVFACAELPVFFASGSPVGVGAEAGVSAKWWLFEPYADVGVQHFFSTPSASYPDNYVLIGAGLRVHVP